TLFRSDKYDRKRQYINNITIRIYLLGIEERGISMYLAIEGVEKSFQNKDKHQVKALEDINFEVEKGQFLSIIGPSGCGKSTSLYLIAGLDQIDKGEITVGGKKVTNPGSDRVVVFQEDGLYAWASVLDNVTYGLHLKNMPKKEAEEIARVMLKMVHLSKYVDA